MPQVIARWAGTITSARPYHYPPAANIVSRDDVRRFIAKEIAPYSWARVEDMYSATRFHRIVALRARIFQAVFKMQGWDSLSKMSRFFGFDRSSIRNCLSKSHTWIEKHLHAEMMGQDERRWMIKNGRIPPAKTKKELYKENQQKMREARKLQYDKQCIALVKARSAGVSVADAMDRFGIHSRRAYERRCHRGRELTRGQVTQILYRTTG